MAGRAQELPAGKLAPAGRRQQGYSFPPTDASSAAISRRSFCRASSSSVDSLCARRSGGVMPWFLPRCPASQMLCSLTRSLAALATAIYHDMRRPGMRCGEARSVTESGMAMPCRRAHSPIGPAGRGSGRPRCPAARASPAGRSAAPDVADGGTRDRRRRCRSRDRGESA